MGGFSTIPGSKNKYPERISSDPQNNSSNFVYPYKVQSGATRGDQQIKGRIMVVDATGVVRMIIGYDPGRF